MYGSRVGPLHAFSILAYYMYSRMQESEESSSRVHFGLGCRTHGLLPTPPCLPVTVGWGGCCNYYLHGTRPGDRPTFVDAAADHTR